MVSQHGQLKIDSYFKYSPSPIPNPLLVLFLTFDTGYEEPRAIMVKSKGVPPGLPGVTTALAESPQSPAVPGVKFHNSILKTPSSAQSNNLEKALSRVHIDSSDDDSIEVNCGTGRAVVMEPGCDVLDLMVINPPAFKSNGKQFAILAIHLPNFFHDENVNAVITKDGRRCEVTLTKPSFLFDDMAVCLCQFGADSAISQAITDWCKSQQEHAGDSIKYTITFRLPFQAKANFSERLLPNVQNGFVNAFMEGGNNAKTEHWRQVVLVFEEHSTNQFDREIAKTVTVNLTSGAVQEEVSNDDFVLVPPPPNTNQDSFPSSSSAAPNEQCNAMPKMASTPTINNLSSTPVRPPVARPSGEDTQRSSGKKRKSPHTPSESQLFEMARANRGGTPAQHQDDGSDISSLISYSTFQSVGRSLATNDDDLSYDTTE